MCLQALLAKSLSEPQPSQMKGLKRKRVLQRSHSAEPGATTAACGAPTEDGWRERVSGQPITVAPSTRDLQNSLAALRPQPPAPAIEGGHQRNVLRKVAFLLRIKFTLQIVPVSVCFQRHIFHLVVLLPLFSRHSSNHTLTSLCCQVLYNLPEAFKNQHCSLV